MRFEEALTATNVRTLNPRRNLMAGLVRCHLRGVVLTRKARRVILREREGLKLDTGVSSDEF
jgi:hypothetical protein